MSTAAQIPATSRSCWSSGAFPLTEGRLGRAAPPEKRKYGETEREREEEEEEKKKEEDPLGV